MFIQKRIEAMGGGSGAYRRRRGEGDGEGGNGPEPSCGEAHEDCPEPSNESYCGLVAYHTGKHKCESCERSF